ncbi:snapalysin family zinc-dependent metalloprotease [Angustibacter sp. Root456]|uniref:snapalysin family zinc-dependent metalloprotease n=1 Tax=Angustibacter sp. Root456 TaxID=1736539 RepID=UPI0006FCEDAC|nr:snapalysin family zinc-dependent metalloprotease [Angustibacter sp. Root456]KQX66488.1 ABC transporter substrate-binding protein [Angustibacter sp. Root456]
MTSRTRSVRARLLAVAAGLAAGAVVASGAPTTTAATAASTSSAAQSSRHAYTPGSQDDAQNTRLRRQLAQALKAQANQLDATPRSGRQTAAAAVVYYDASNAPSFAYEIAQSASIWNSSVSNVRLVRGYPADLTYYEGSDSRGSYASTDGHGHGYILIDYSQAQRYAPLRIVAHETGHVLGLPDHYSGPCSELMSGGGPGPSCTNPYPNSTERRNVNALWAYGFAARFPTQRSSDKSPALSH